MSDKETQTEPKKPPQTQIILWRRKTRHTHIKRNKDSEAAVSVGIQAASTSKQRPPSAESKTQQPAISLS